MDGGIQPKDSRHAFSFNTCDVVKQLTEWKVLLFSHRNTSVSVGLQQIKHDIEVCERTASYMNVWFWSIYTAYTARMGEGSGVHRVLVGKPERKRPLGRPRRRCEDNIKMDLQEMGRGCGNWMELTQDRDR